LVSPYCGLKKGFFAITTSLDGKSTNKKWIFGDFSERKYQFTQKKYLH